MTNQGFDEANWSPYNQFPIIYGPQAEIGHGVMQTSVSPEIFPEDIYDMDKGWRVKEHAAILEGVKGGPVREVVQSGDLEGWYKNMASNQEKTLAFIKKNAEAKKPFYVAYWPHLIAFAPFPDRKTLSGGFLQEGLVRIEIRKYVNHTKRAYASLGTATVLLLRTFE